MKLRFRDNSLRLRLNQREVQALLAGQRVRERVVFPGNAILEYVLGSEQGTEASASFEQGTIQVIAPKSRVCAWASGEDLGLYFDFPANGSTLRVSIEKDLECLDGPSEERDPEAFPRTSGKNC